MFGGRRCWGLHLGTPRRTIHGSDVSGCPMGLFSGDLGRRGGSRGQWPAALRVRCCTGWAARCCRAQHTPTSPSAVQSPGLRRKQGILKCPNTFWTPPPPPAAGVGVQDHTAPPRPRLGGHRPQLLSPNTVPALWSGIEEWDGGSQSRGQGRGPGAGPMRCRWAARKLHCGGGMAWAPGEGGGGEVPEMGFRAGPVVLCKDRCCHQRRRNTNFGLENFFSQKNFFSRKNFPPHMCSQNDQRDVGIILSHVCWGRTPPPPWHGR